MPQEKATVDGVDSRAKINVANEVGDATHAASSVEDEPEVGLARTRKQTERVAVRVE